PEQPQARQPAEKPSPTPRKPKKEHRARSAASRSVPTLGSAPSLESNQQQPYAQPQYGQPDQVPDLPAANTPSATSSTGLSDDELQQRNLPPLRGPWVRVQREPRAISPRDEAEMQLRSIEIGYSPWIGGAGILKYHSGDLG